VQVVKFSEVFPDNARAYSYAAVTLAGGVALGVAVFGWAGWT
jgi:hypothetical protein